MKNVSKILVLIGVLMIECLYPMKSKHELWRIEREAVYTRTKLINNYLENSRINDVKHYLKNNWNLVQEQSLVVHPESSGSPFCTPLYYFSVIKKEYEITRWMLDNYALPESPWVAVNCMVLAIKHDKKFDQPWMFKILKNYSPYIMDKPDEVYGTLLERAVKDKNKSAQTMMLLVLKEDETIQKQLSELKDKLIKN